jgi:CheY-like chemotaxis protein
MTDSDFSSANAPILVASDAVADAELVETLLRRDEFSNVRLSVKPDEAVSDFDAHQPFVLILAFDSLEAAQQYIADLERLSKTAQTARHRTLILCTKDDLWRVYELCKKERFDDYVLFWPITNDAPRLPMAVHHALRRMKETVLDQQVTVNQLAAKAGHLATLESELTQYMSQVDQQIDIAGLTVAQAEQALNGALDELPGSLPDHPEPAAAGGLDRIRIANIRKHFQSIANIIGGLQRAASESRHALGARLAPVRGMLELAGQVRPVVLMVDDDEFQHKLISHALGGYNIDLVFASSAAEIMGLMWRHRPNVVLMDIELPDVDGVEATRRIRNIANFADTQVVMLTGHSERDVVVESLKAGAADFLVKPLDSAKLIQKLGGFIPMDTA